MSIIRQVLLIIPAFFVLGMGNLQAHPGPVLSGVKELKLKNGMKFLLLPRPGAPVFSAYIRVKAGGVDEAKGETGIAHLLEHMAFKGTSEIGTREYSREKKLLDRIEAVQAEIQKASGSEREKLEKTMKALTAEAGNLVVKEEFSKIYQRNGATGLNATTSQDVTSYFVTLPSNKLRLWAYLESSRLRDPVFREFYSERDVVMEERRTRVDDSPFGALYEAFTQLAFENSPYRQPTIGYPEDLARLTASDLSSFYNKYYSPSNMVGALVGNFDLKEAESIIREYFGALPGGEAPPTFEVKEPEPKQEKRIEVPFDAAPSLMFGYLKPTMPHPDDYVFDLLEQILCEGVTSRLYRDLVVKKKLVQTLACATSTPGSRMENLFMVYGSIHQGHSVEEIYQAFDAEMEKIKKNGIEDKELAKAKKNLLSQWYFDLQSNNDIAETLSYFEAVAGDWRYILGHQKQIQGITSKDIQRVVARYLSPGRRRGAVLVPRSKISGTQDERGRARADSR